ncbi:LysM peptidoglycan-binding domain-containing protein [Ahrensia marina]|uniref:LysM peptidoglycan-binding domain-containing protein n=1 Tax=Ahrensia marina TaxID=1514904 RepID=UPI0006B5F406|nr:LysM peptidoglycan-binding domain-containing protein [Ahrensia marina]
MGKESIGVWLFAGVIGLTGLGASGYLGDPNKLLEPFKSISASSDVTENAAETTPEPQDEKPAETEKAEMEPSEPKQERLQVEEEAGAVEEKAVAPEETEVTEKPSVADESENTAESSSATDSDVESDTAIAEPETSTQETSTQKTEQATAEAEQKPEAEPEKQAEAAPESIVPTFDILRVEPNGDMVIAGVAASNADVEIVAGSKSLAVTKSNNSGEFVAILDEPLAQGDYEIVLRATQNDGSVATSLETAIVSIPEKGSNDVLALVEAPGAPSRLITKLEPKEAVQTAEAPEVAGSEEDEAVAEINETPKPAAPEEEAAQIAENEPLQEEPPQQKAGELVRIEAVEIDGEKVFVAGATDAGARIRVYANEIVLGEDIANDEGRFLVEANRNLPVGDYVIRADRLSENGVDVVSRAAVPFARAEGTKLAAVAVPKAPELPDNAPEISSEPADTAPDSSATAEASDDNNAPATVSNVEDTPTKAEVAASPRENVTDDQVAESTAPQSQPATEQQVAATQKPADIQTTGNVNERLKPVDSSVIIRRGDTLWQISRRVYGRGIKYTTIYQANEDQIKNPHKIWPGQVFALPENADESDTAAN